MAGIMDDLMGALSGGAGGGLGDLLGGVMGGADPAKSEKAAGLGLEAILGGLAQNAQNPKGAQALRDALGKHDGSVLNDVSGRLRQPETAADGGKILGHIFGDKQEAVTQNLAQKSGLDMGSIAKMLPALAPVVMGMLSKKASSDSLDAGGLAGMLKQESDGFDLGDLMGLLGGAGGAAGAMGILAKLKSLFTSRR